jgi:hypothetical protein
MRPIPPLFVALCVTLAASAAETPVPLPIMAEPAKPNGWTGFSLLPKAFQRHPNLEMTVLCELTEFGRTVPAATPEAPVYYDGHNSGYLSRGDTVGSHPPAADYLDRVLQHALAKTGYRPATAKHAPTLLLVFHWGSHHAMDREMANLFRVRARQHFQERVTLVGGQRMESLVDRRATFEEFVSRYGERTEFLTYQAHDSLYFAIVSAYDVPSLQQGQRRLVWRAHLTVNARGVSMADSLPALILTGAPSFGRDMPAPEIVLRRIRRGEVEYGPAQVIETDVALPAPASPFSQSN